MNQEEREVYVALTESIESNICPFCKNSEFLGCGDGVACIHPDKDEDSCECLTGDEELPIGGDCHGFEPEYSVDFITDIISVILQNNFSFESWSFRTFDDGTIKVYGHIMREKAGVK